MPDNIDELGELVVSKLRPGEESTGRQAIQCRALCEGPDEEVEVRRPPAFLPCSSSGKRRQAHCNRTLRIARQCEEDLIQSRVGCRSRGGDGGIDGQLAL